VPPQTTYDMIAVGSSVRHSWLPYWLRLGGHAAPDDEPAKIKDCLTKLGINSRTWKLYAEYGDRLFHPLSNGLLSPEDPEASLANAIAYLRLLNGCEVDMAPPPELAAALSQCNLPDQSIAAMPIAVFRGAWRGLVEAGYRGMTARAFVVAEFIPVMRWYFADGRGRGLDLSRGKAGWSWLRGRWSEEQARRALPAGPKEWPTPLRGAQIGNVRFIPLQSTTALEDEGRVMRHCVGELAECCLKGCINVFSVRNAKTLDRIATLALRAEEGNWAIAELKAEQNHSPEEYVTRSAMSLLSCLAESAPAPRGTRENCDGCPLGL